MPLLLLDSDVEANAGPERETTDRLYGGGTDHRLAQEVLLGIGGVRAIRAYCRITGAPAPEVFHTNEGHAGFLGLERIREYMGDGLDFDTALERCRAGTVFTTHTPVPAGIDRFPHALVVDQFASFDDVPLDRVLALGSEDYEGGDPAMFNMAVMGFRLGQRANGVSLLHGEVSRGMFHGLVGRLRHHRGADRLDHQRRPPLHLGAHAACSSCSRRRPAARRPRSSTATTGTGLATVDSQTIWDAQAHDARRAGGDDPHAGSPRAASAAGSARSGSTRCSTPTSSPSGSPAGCPPTSG